MGEEELVTWLKILYPHVCISCDGLSHCHSGLVRDLELKRLLRKRGGKRDFIFLWGHLCPVWR